MYWMNFLNQRTRNQIIAALKNCQKFGDRLSKRMDNMGVHLKKKIFHKKDPIGGNLMREIDCAHSRSVKTPS
jgi:hypothetical protein